MSGLARTKSFSFALITTLAYACLAAPAAVVAEDSINAQIGFEREFGFDRIRFQQAAARVARDGIARIDLHNSDGSLTTVELYERTDTGDGAITLTGAIVGRPQSHIELSLDDGLLRGRTSFYLADGRAVSHDIARVGEDRYALEQVRARPLAVDDDALDLSVNMRGNTGPGIGIEQLRSTSGGDVNADSAFSVQRRNENSRTRPGVADNGNTIDLLVVFTEAAQKYIGSPQAIKSAIDLNVQRTNFAFVDSKINTQIRLLDAIQLGPFPEGSVRFRQLATVGDGVLDNLPRIRERYAADLVMVISLDVHNNAGQSVCGQAAIPNLARDPRGDFAGYSWVSAYCLEGSMTFTHELGHNLNAQHDRSDPFVYGAGKPRRFNFAYSARNGRYRSIMDTGENCLAQNCPPLHYFSTPSVRPHGNRIGLRNANNAKTINQFRSKVAAYRIAKVVKAPTIWVRSTKGDLNSDDPVVYLSANGTEVEGWRIQAGATSAQTNIFDSGVRAPEVRRIRLNWAPKEIESNRMAIRLEYRVNGQWRQTIKTVALKSEEAFWIKEQSLWLIDILRGWASFITPRADRLLIKSELIRQRALAQRGAEEAVEESVAKIERLTDGCKQLSIAGYVARPDANDAVRSCWAQQELQLGLRTILSHANGLVQKGAIRGWRDRCLQVKSRNRSAVVIDECSTRAIEEQVWQLTEDGKLISAGRCLDAGSDDPESGRDVRMATCLDVDRQRWRVDEGRLISLTNPQACLSVQGPHPAAGEAIETAVCEAGVAWQQWMLLDE